MSLTELKSGQKARIIEIRGGTGLLKKLEAMGLRIGSSVINLSSNFMRGPVIVQNGCTQIAIGQGIARKIIVQP